MSPHLQRAQLHLEQSRSERAEEELRLHLASDPDDPIGHAFLAQALADQEKLKEATAEAQAAIRLAPDLDFAYYVLACVFDQRDRLDEAEAAICEAIRLDPEDANYYALLGGLKLQQRRWDVALQNAERGLELDAEHVGCNNLRSMALMQLGRKAEAGATIGAALAREPENALVHATQGWTLLNRGEHKQALEHFREALRLEPNLEYARAGIVEALKSRHLIYRLFLAYAFWMSRLSRGAQWGVIIGLYVGYRVVRNLAKANPDWAPYLYPVLMLYGAFAILTWLGQPIFNLILRLNRFGRLALSREQVESSNWVGLCLLLALGALVLALVTRSPQAILATLVFGLLSLPVSATFDCQPGWPRRAMTGYTTILVVAGLVAIFAPDTVSGRSEPRSGPDWGRTAAVVFMLGTFLAAFVANALAMARPKR